MCVLRFVSAVYWSWYSNINVIHYLMNIKLFMLTSNASKFVFFVLILPLYAMKSSVLTARTHTELYYKMIHSRLGSGLTFPDKCMATLCVCPIVVKGALMNVVQRCSAAFYTSIMKRFYFYIVFYHRRKHICHCHRRCYHYHQHYVFHYFRNY